MCASPASIRRQALRKRHSSAMPTSLRAAPAAKRVGLELFVMDKSHNPRRSRWSARTLSFHSAKSQETKLGLKLRGCQRKWGAEDGLHQRLVAPQLVAFLQKKESFRGPSDCSRPSIACRTRRISALGDDGQSGM